VAGVGLPCRVVTSGRPLALRWAGELRPSLLRRVGEVGEQLHCDHEPQAGTAREAGGEDVPTGRNQDANPTALSPPGHEPHSRAERAVYDGACGWPPLGAFDFPDPGDPKAGPRLDGEVLEPDGPDLERYRITEGVWKALVAHRARHEDKGSGFGYGIAEPGGVTRTLSARYYKDGAEILLRMPTGEVPRRLTPREAARLMGFRKSNLGFEFEIPVSDVQAYKQFGNSVVVPQFQWVADAIVGRAGALFARRIREAAITGAIGLAHRHEPHSAADEVVELVAATPAT
jgi:hypothetical protein